MSTQPQLLLAIDTSGADAGLVLADERTADVAMLPVDRGFARTEDLGGELARLLERRGARPEDLTIAGAVVGPGSYTGLRSGLAFLRGVAFSRNLPAVAVGALELLAWRTGRAGETVRALWPAGKGRTLVGSYACSASDVEERVAPRSCDDAGLASFLAGFRDDASVLAVSDGAAFPSLAFLQPESLQRLRRESLPGLQPESSPLEVRSPAASTFARLADLVRSRAASGRTTTTGELLPVYVGLTVREPASNTTAQVSDAS